MPDGKRIVVTGGTRGIGAAIVAKAVAAGAQVAFTGRDEKAAESVLEAVAEHSGASRRRVTFVKADFADPDAAGAAVSSCADILGGLDVLVNNAAMGLRRDLDSASVDDWRAMLDVNLLAPFFAAQAASRVMSEGGVIINMASEMGRLANPQSLLYGVTKAALLHLNSGLALALADRGIRVVAVAPGPVRTAMLEGSVRQAGEDPAEGLAKYAARIPLKRLAMPDEVADTVLFVASDKAAFMTGAVVNLDGGSTIASG